MKTAYIYKNEVYYIASDFGDEVAIHPEGLDNEDAIVVNKSDLEIAHYYERPKIFFRVIKKGFAHKDFATLELAKQEIKYPCDVVSDSSKEYWHTQAKSWYIIMVAETMERKLEEAKGADK